MTVEPKRGRGDRLVDWLEAHPNINTWAMSIATYLALRYAWDAPAWAAVGFALVIFMMAGRSR
jgi:hypothetical protein